MKKYIVAILLVAMPALPQGTQGIPYTVNKQTALTASAEVITIQQPASGARNVYFDSAYVSSTVSATITLEIQGTAATTTTLAVNPVTALGRASAVTAFSASNVGVGTVLAVYDIPANGGIVIDLSHCYLPPTVANANITLRSNSITGTLKFVVTLSEQ